MAQVKIRIESGINQSGVGNASAVGTKSDSEKNKVSAKSIFAHQMVATAKQTMNYAVNNIGNFTGNYIMQSQIQNALDMVGDASTLVMGAVSSGAVGLAVAAVGIATKKTFEIVSSVRNDTLSERQRAYMMERSGNATKNGSRGTEN